jgi:hypothetical protein
MIISVPTANGSRSTQPLLQDFIAAIGPHLETTGDWRQEIPWFGATGRRILMCRGSSLCRTQ